MEYINPSKRTQKHGSELPHWQQGQCIQFATFRLADSLPKELIKRWSRDKTAWMATHPKPWSRLTAEQYHKIFSQKIERSLDQGIGKCLLEQPINQSILGECLNHFDGTRVIQHAWVIMPNHVHILFEPLVPVAKLMQSWKGYSATRIGKGPIWQRGYYDTLIRDVDHYMSAVRYIRRNPIKAKLRQNQYLLWDKGVRE